MRSQRLPTVLLVGLAVTAIAVRPLPAPVAAAETLPSDSRTILHVLNRMAYGPRPGDVEKIRAVGVQSYIDQQLRPDKIADPAMNDRLKELSTLQLSSREIADRYERPALDAQRARREAQTAGDSVAPAMADPVQQRANRVVV